MSCRLPPRRPVGPRAVLLRACGQPGFVAVARGGAPSSAEGTTVPVEIGYAALRATFTVDRASGRLLGFAYRGRTRTGSYGLVEERLDDWRDVEGVRIPFRRDLSNRGEELVPGGVKVIEARVNAALPDELFHR